MEATIYLNCGVIFFTPRKLGKTNRARRVISTNNKKDAILDSFIKSAKTQSNNAKRNADYKAKRSVKRAAKK